MAEIARQGTLALADPNGAGVPSRVLGRPFGLLTVNGSIANAVAGLLSVNITSRIISGLSILIAVWLYEPVEFARFGALLASLTLASAVQFLRYEATIVSARNSFELRSAIRLTGVVGLGIWLAMAAAILFLTATNLVGADVGWLFMLALAGRAVCRMVGRIVVRNGDYRLLGQATFALAAVQPVVILIAWLMGMNGMVAMALTDIVGNLSAGSYLIWRCRGPLRDALNVSKGDPSLLALAREWISLPLVNLPSTALATAFTAVPLLVVLSLAEASVAGHIALAFRLLDVPTQILAAAISPIAMNRFNREGYPSQLGRDPALVAWLLMAVALVFGSVSIAALYLEPWLHATAWRGVSEFLPFVALFQGGVALALPLIEVAGLRRNQRDLFIIQALAMVGVGLLAVTLSDWRFGLLCFGLLAAVRALSLAVPLLFRHEPRSTV